MGTGFSSAAGSLALALLLAYVAWWLVEEFTHQRPRDE